ncbi:MAG: hypothetical protein RL173_1019 [Fibrobacterota bacterium]|jgi:hypothetical protein
MMSIRRGQAVTITLDAPVKVVHNKLLEHGLRFVGSASQSLGPYAYNANKGIVVFVKSVASSNSAELIVCLRSLGCIAVQRLVRDLQIPFSAKHTLAPMFGHDLEAIEQAALAFRKKHPTTLIQFQSDCLVVAGDDSALYLTRDPDSGHVLAEVRVDAEYAGITRVLQRTNCGVAWLTELDLARKQHPTSLIGQAPEVPRDLVIIASKVMPEAPSKVHDIADQIHHSICDAQGPLHTIVVGAVIDIKITRHGEAELQATLLMRDRSSGDVAVSYRNLVNAIFQELFVDHWFSVVVADPSLDRREFTRRYLAKATNPDTPLYLYAKSDLASRTRPSKPPSLQLAQTQV